MIYLIGDLHGEIDIGKMSFKQNPFLKDLTEEDYIIQLGDMGSFWSVPRTKSEKYWLDWLSNQKYNFLFLDGNHENFDLINAFEEIDMFDGKVGAAYPNIFHLKRGEVYNIAGNKILVIGGATSRDKVYRKENISWWPEEELSLKEIKHIEDNIVKHDHKVDYVLTHTPPDVLKTNFGFHDTVMDSVAAYFNSIYKLVDFKHWYSSHLHIDQTIDNVTVLYDKIIKLGDTISES